MRAPLPKHPLWLLDEIHSRQNLLDQRRITGLANSTHLQFSMGIEAASQAPASREFNLAVLRPEDNAIPSPSTERLPRPRIESGGPVVAGCDH